MKAIFSLTVSFILIAVSSLVLNDARQTVYKYQDEPPVLGENIEKPIKYVIVPVLLENTIFPMFSAQAVLVEDLDSGVILYEKNSNTPFLPASTTKIITALVAMDNYPLDEIVIVGNVDVEGQKMHLVTSEQISVENLLYGLLVYSANDAAEVLAQNYPGGRDAFINAMNLKSTELELVNTFFENPTGFDGVNQKTTARDLIKTAKIAMQRPFFRKAVGTKEIVVESENGEIVHHLININKLVGEVEGVVGVKTGWTENARENLVTYIERGDKKVMMVVLGSQDRFGETEKLIEWVFANYEWREVEVPQKVAQLQMD
ncbi:D-alanyl-D-alanine carboxypeptidase [Patescibacteria group bacterium]|nr:D-alanyl-D-alanine carboxypeptidase [Patescibacteria group bacterium]